MFKFEQLLESGKYCKAEKIADNADIEFDQKYETNKSPFFAEIYSGNAISNFKNPTHYSIDTKEKYLNVEESAKKAREAYRSYFYFSPKVDEHLSGVEKQIAKAEKYAEHCEAHIKVDDASYLPKDPLYPNRYLHLFNDIGAYDKASVIFDERMKSETEEMKKRVEEEGYCIIQ